MRKRGIQVLAAMMSALLVVQSPGVSGFLSGSSGIAYADVHRQATVGATTLNVRSGPGTNNTIVKKLSHGAAVTVVGEERDSSGTVWYKIRFTAGSQTKEGYASSQYINFPTQVAQDTNFDRYLSQQGFPESYKDSLRTLHAQYPNWIFQAQNTGLDWKDVIANEGAVGANLVSNSSISSWKSTEYGAYDWNNGKWTGFDGASWVAASEEIVCYYMDPRNFLNDIYIFQFLNHNYDSSLQTKEGLQSMVTGTFLEKTVTSAGNGTGAGSGNAADGPGGQNGPGGASQSPDSAGPGVYKPSVGTGGPGAVNQNGNTGGPGSGNQSGNAAGPGTSQNSGGAVQDPIRIPAQSQGSDGTQSQQGGVQMISPNGNSQGNVSLEGPPVSVSARTMGILAVPKVEYGPGMDASSITGDNTGASTTSPVPVGQSYVDIIMKAASQSGVNPYVLCAMIIQEQGKGTSGSISGTTTGYQGYYNFFNVGAYQAGSMSAVTRGLWYASQSGNYGRPWNSIEKSIIGGSQYYGENYVKQGQDTFYLKKFNVQGNNLYKHQYMTNVEGAAGEGAKLANAYTTSMKDEALVFKIPVYKNMPETACAKPTGSGSPNNKLSGLTVTGYALTPTFNMNTESYDIIVNPSVERVEVKASMLDSKASVSGVGTVELQSGNNTISVEVKAENGHVRTYKLNVVRQSNAPAVNVAPGSSQNTGYSNGPGAPVQSGTSGGPGAVNQNGNQTGNGGTNGPGQSNGSDSGVTTAPPQIITQETPSAADTSVSIVKPQGVGSNQDVQVGVGPGSGSGSAGNSAAIQPTASQAPAATEAPTQAETQAPETTAPTQAPETEAPQQTQPQEAALKKGDCNGDGSVTILDLMLIKKQVLGQNVLSGAKKTAADMNGDGKITSEDAAALQKIIFGQ